MSSASNVGVVRLLWAAARENDVDALVSLTTQDVDWRPTAVAVSRLQGRDQLRGYLESLRHTGRLADAHPYSFEAVGGCVIVSGALLVRRDGGGIDVVRRWWVYRVIGGKVAAAGSHASRAEALHDARGSGV